MQPLDIKPRLCRYAGILNLTAQGGHSKFNFGFIGLATITPIEQIPRPMHNLLVQGIYDIHEHGRDL